MSRTIIQYLIFHIHDDGSTKARAWRALALCPLSRTLNTIRILLGLHTSYSTFLLRDLTSLFQGFTPMRRPLCLRASTAWLVLLLAALQLPCHEGLTVRICIPYPEGESSSFRDRCTAAVSTANTEELEFECVAGGSVDNVR